MTNFEEALKLANFDNPCTDIEYRLYYDDSGDPLFYSPEELDGNFVVVTKEDHTQGRYDIKVVNGKIIYPTEYVYQKLTPQDNGIECNINDVSIIGKGQKWSLTRYE